MGLDHTLVGVPSEPQERSWDSKDALLYAVGVGAGLGDPLQELEFTTENCEGIQQKVLPTFGVLIAQARPGRTLGDFDRAMVVPESVAVDAHTSEPLVTSRSSAFIRGEGGFGGERGTDAPWEHPDREPDHRVVQATRPGAAPLYRLSG